MAGTAAEIRRSLMARIPDLAGVSIEAKGIWHVVVHAKTSNALNASKLEQELHSAFKHVMIAGTRIEVVICDELPDHADETIPPSVRMAALLTNQSMNGLREALVRLLPDVERLVLEEVQDPRFQGRMLLLRVLVARSDGSCPDALISQVNTAIKGVGFVGLNYVVEALPKADRRNDINNLGIFVPNHSPSTRTRHEADENYFYSAMTRLVSGCCPSVPVLDDLDGSRILCQSHTLGETPVSCFLPLYDRVFVVVPPGLDGRSRGKDLYKTTFGLSKTDFVRFARRQRIIPVFKFDTGIYPGEFCERILEDPAIAFVSPRHLDIAAARFLWTRSEYLRQIRHDRQLSSALYAIADEIQDCAFRVHNHQERTHLLAVHNMLRQALVSAESFEGYLWNRGHTLLGSTGPALPLASLMDFLPEETSKATRDSIALQASSAAMSIGMGQAFNATVFDDMPFSDEIVEATSQMFVPDSPVLTNRRGHILRQVIDALELSYNESIPADEYMDIFDLAETRRMRHIVGELELGKYRSPQDDELRDRMQQFNSAIQRLRKRDLKMKEVDVVATGARVIELGGEMTANPMLSALGRPFSRYAYSNGPTVRECC